MSVVAPAPAIAQGVPAASPDRGRVGVRALLRRPLALASLCYLALIVAAVLIVPLLPSSNPSAEDLLHVLAGPSAHHWLGTDQLGRDIGIRLLVGGRSALLDVVMALAAYLVAGVPIAVMAGYQRGRLDRVVMRIADLMFAMPVIVVLLMVVSVFPNSNPAAMIAVGILAAPGLIRVVRAVTLATRSELYVTAARLSGLRTSALLRRHVLPSLAGPIIVQGSLFCAGALIAESGLSFLGLLTPDASGPTWGNMVSDASAALSQDPWFLVPTGGIIALTVIAFSVLGDAVRDVTVNRASAPTNLPPSERRGTLNAGARLGSAATAMTAGDGGRALLEFSGVTVCVNRNGIEVTTLQDVSFAVEAGESLGIVGESGCGKTLTARAILGLLPSVARVTSGSIIFDGLDLTTLSERAFARVRGSGIALVSQDPISSLDPTFTVASQLREVIRTHVRVTRREADARAEELLRKVRLPDPAAVLKLRVHELSGGMAQRVAIALALAGEPRLLIADEPTTALDVTVQAEILALLSDLRKELKMTLILVTHDWGVLADACERVLVMYAGEIVEEGSVEEIYSAPRHPYSAALLASNPQLTSPGNPLPTIPGAVPDPATWPRGCHFEGRCAYAVEACGIEPVPLLPVGTTRAARCIRTDEIAEQLCS